MAWYVVAILGKCYTLGCTRDGTHEVRNECNETIGRYCHRHALAVVRDHGQGPPPGPPR